jgi:microcystin-dependent protein
MEEPFLGEIRIFATGAIPDGWLPCDGRSMPINRNQALFSLIGFEYGGDQKTTFNLPDLRGAVPVHFGGAPIDHEYVEGLQFAESAKGTGPAVPTVAVAYAIAVEGYYPVRES